jgi:hypothetical protein
LRTRAEKEGRSMQQILHSRRVVVRVELDAAELRTFAG